MQAPAALDAPLGAPHAARVRALEQRYREIAATRMAGVALCHPGLEVAAVDFAPEPGGAGALGALVTPWFMNLVWLPTPAAIDPASAPAPLSVGGSRKRAVGPELFEFIGAHETGLGDFEACSLFSPMFEFADQAAAVETARAVLRLLREPAAPVSSPVVQGRAAEPSPSPPSSTSPSPLPSARPSALPSASLSASPSALLSPSPSHVLPASPLPSSSASPAAPPRRSFLFGRSGAG
ncbi:MAG: [NiFe]-hydrogenase assembly chaperone HybE [Rubrivivax sp.]|nr:[NiFe]-hydrogenase assembly chaperone HybE [Rubrivivax sp.]